MKEAVDNGEVAGLQYALLKDGEVVVSRSHGNRSLEGGAPLDEDTMFRIRSMTKPITAVAMMQLWEQGKWRLDDPITTFLPEFEGQTVMVSPDSLTDTTPMSRPPTMQELMTHTAGLGYGLFAANAVDRILQADTPLNRQTLDEMVEAVRAVPLVAQPGEKWSYSIGIDLQGAIIERISGQSLGEYFEESIFAPLGMTDTMFFVDQTDADRLAATYQGNPQTGELESYVETRSFFVRDHVESAGGGLASTTRDYSRFMQMLLNGGELDGARVLKPETVQLMMQNHIGEFRAMTGGGFGFGGAIELAGDAGQDAGEAGAPPGTYSWFGAEGTWFWIDPAHDIAFDGMIQRRGGGRGFINLRGESERLVYSALQ